ncbi:MAG: thiamine-phosphate pyrophosphorylase [Pseudohongiellaceae bacterium]|jgi:thiamine-phosphate pyrophosphorylase
MSAANGAEMTGSLQDRLSAVRLYLIATADSEPQATPAWLQRVSAAVRGGVGAVQLRQKGTSTEVRRQWLTQLREVLGPQVLLLANDDLSAVRSPTGARLADGLHLGREDAEALGAHTSSAREERRRAGLALARKSLGPELLLGTSTRAAHEIDLALAAGADHVGFGAMSATPTKPEAIVARPAELTRCLERFPSLPLFPIGGISEKTLPRWVALGCLRAAVSSAILEADDPEASALALMRHFEKPCTR